ncbi:MAG TPA: FecR domain-containing protein [Gemmatimonadaceae bacterium]|nr:FecR domain-containing protein [Gemmatimonadaceae bacterium]
MSTSVPPRDGGTRTESPSALTSTSVLADEQALKRLFDAEFTASLTSARGHLGEAASLAPKVVEGAFVHVWNERASITTATQLSSMLAEQVMHGSARALSRRASGHRFGALGASGNTGSHAVANAADPARVWAQIETAIHGPDRSASTRAALTAPGVVGHGAAEHMKSATKKRSWVVPIAIGVVALVVSVAGVLYVDRLGEDDAILSTVDAVSIQPLAGSEAGQFATLVLGDGTKAHLAPQTKLFVPDGFPSKIRALRLEGTAMFDVAKGQSLPFRVVAKKIHVIATGTQFVVSAYPSDSGINVQVREGSVTVKSTGAPLTVAAGQAIHFEKGAARPATDDEQLAAFAWVDGRVGLQHRPLSATVDALSRWYGLDIKIPDLGLVGREASFSAPIDSSLLAISQVEKSANVKFTYEGDTKIFKDAKKK